MKAKVKKINHIFDGLKDEKSNENSKKLYKELKQICKNLKISVESESIEGLSKALFSDGLDDLKKKGVVAHSLIFLSREPDLIWSYEDFRINLFSYYDDQISSNVYKILQLEQNTGNHLKLEKLRDIDQKFRKSFIDLVDTIISLQTAVRVRQSYMKNLRHPLNKIFLDAFVRSPLITEERIGEFFDSVQNYESSSPVDKVEAYQKFKQIYDRYIGDMGKQINDVTKICIQDPLQKIWDLIEKDFDSNDAIKKTQVTIAEVPRKYPFHLPGRDLSLKLRVTNKGPGHAFDVQVDLSDIEGFTQETKSVSLGTIPPGSSEIVFKGTTLPNASSPGVLGELRWNNFGGEGKSEDFYFEFEAQKTDIDWDGLKIQRPYSLSAVESEEDLAGRDDVINDLFARSTAEDLESSIIYGQKRVGKTSIAKTLENKLKKANNHIVVFVSVGELDITTAQNCVTDLGTKILKEVLNQCDLPIDIPKISGALAPLGDVFDQIIHYRSDQKITIIIDEFDEVLGNLYPSEDNDIGNAFFLNIRGLSSKKHVCFVLVGGENMRRIQYSTDRLNHFQTFPVDYLNKEKYWDDFRALVQNPVKDKIEYDSAAIDALYAVTAGNPFFTKMLCGNVYSDVCKTRDAYITEEDVQKTIRDTLLSLDVQNMNHFWKDGISEDDAEQCRVIESLRIRLLRAFADLNRKQQSVTKDTLKDTSILRQSGAAIDPIIDSFVTRKIFIEEEDGHYRCKPMLLEKWLVETGGHNMGEFEDATALQILTDTENDAFVTDIEIDELTDGWSSTYRGKVVDVAKVNRWLDQFDNNIERRLMFKLLQNLKFYNEQYVREKLRSINEFIYSNITRLRKGRERYRREILVSCFDTPAKSGASIARLYTQENSIISENCCNLQDIPSILTNPKRRQRIQAVVFVDDLIGSGGSMIAYISKMKKICGNIFTKNNDLSVFITSVCGLESGVSMVEKSLESLNYSVQLKVCDLLTEEAQCFSDFSQIFESKAERLRAENIVRRHGKNLYPRHPLGFNNGQLLLTFHQSCPNNSLPILWADERDWYPLFKRH